jgi:hypothetical protein
MCQFQHNQTLKKPSPKINPKLNRYLVATKNTKSTNKTQKSDWLTVENVKVHKWMKNQVPGSKESGSGIIRVAFCCMCAVLCAWVIASSKVVCRPWTGIWYLFAPTRGPSHSTLTSCVKLFVCLFVITKHPALLFVCSGETHPGAKD